MHLFEELKRKPAFGQPEKIRAKDFSFLLAFDQQGAYLDTIDQQGNTIHTDHRMYNGSIREALHMLEEIQNKNSFVIDWENPQERVYLSNHETLLYFLKYCDNVVTADHEPVHFAEDEGRLTLEMTADADNIHTQLTLQHHSATISELQPLTESYLLANQRVYPVKPMGNNFQQISLFETTFRVHDLEKFLSLFFSFFQNIDLNYSDYQVIYSEEEVHPAPSIIFEKIDEHQSLYLRIAQVLPGFDIDFLEQYDADRIARVNEMEQKIIVKKVNRLLFQDLLKDVSSLVGSVSKSKKKDAFFMEDNLLVLPDTLAKDFIRKKLPVLLTQYTVYGAEKLKTYQIKAVTPTLHVSLSSGIDFLEGDAQLDIEGEKFSLFDAIQQYRKDRYIKLNDGTQAIINEDYIKRLERLFKKKKNKVQLSFFDLPFVEDLIAEKAEQSPFQQSREVWEGFNKLQQQKVKLPAVEATLRPYQKQGYQWLNYLHKHQLGGCLADDMGLGKTLQTITLLSGIYPKEKLPTLIVMPKSLLFNWSGELQKFNPALTFYTYYADNRDMKQACQAHVIMTTYATMRNDIKQFKEQAFYYVILDESQNIKNIQAQTSKSVMLLQTKHRLALSGTPIENNLSELYSLFRFLNPAMFGSAEDFNDYYAKPIQQDNDKEVAKELRRKIYPFVLRRLKKDVLQDLPDKIEKILYVEMSSAQKKLYEQRRQYYYHFLRDQIQQQGIQKSQFFILQALTELRQIATVPEAKSDQQITSAKRELLHEQLMEAIANGHKCLIFVNFLSAIESIGEDLDRSGIDFVSMTGATRDRQALVEQFQQNKNCKVFLMTLKTGGTGLNLTAADTVFIYDPWWNYAAETQAIDRTHRIGQDKTVFSYKLITRGTIEEKILLLQEKKKALFDNIIETDSAALKSLDEADIEFVLG